MFLIGGGGTRHGEIREKERESGVTETTTKKTVTVAWDWKPREGSRVEPENTLLLLINKNINE